MTSDDDSAGQTLVDMRVRRMLLEFPDNPRGRSSSLRFGRSILTPTTVHQSQARAITRSQVVMSDITQLHRALIDRVLDGGGKAPTELRQAAFDNTNLAEPIRTLIEKVAYYAYTVTDDDIAAVRAAGLSEDQIFEIVVCAAIGQASRQYKNALAALASATEEGKR